MDQAKLGAALAPFGDSLMTRAKAKRMNTLFMTSYREMQSDPEFVAVGSVMNTVYRDMFSLSFDNRQLYVYVPPHEPGKKLPAVLFLHGSCGNFKVYMWKWKRFADAHKVAIVAPTFGFGNWHRPGGVEAIESAYSYCASQPEIDSQRIFLAGLS